MDTADENSVMDGIEVKEIDKTFQNRDILKWVARIERGKLFEDSAKDVIDIIGDVLTTDVKPLFTELFSQNSAGVAPEGVIADLSIKPPVAKKILPEGEKHPVSWKDYPVYFLMGLTIRFTISASTEEMKKSPSYFSEWYNAVLGAEIEKRVSEIIRERLFAKFSDIFCFPVKNNEFTENKINIVTSSSLSVTMKGGSMTRSGTAPFKTSEDYRDMLVKETSITLGRIIKTVSESHTDDQEKTVDAAAVEVKEVDS